MKTGLKVVNHCRPRTAAGPVFDRQLTGEIAQTVPRHGKAHSGSDRSFGTGKWFENIFFDRRIDSFSVVVDGQNQPFSIFLVLDGSRKNNSSESSIGIVAVAFPGIREDAGYRILHNFRIGFYNFPVSNDLHLIIGLGFLLKAIDSISKQLLEADG